MLKPVDIDKLTWYYVEEKGLTVVREVNDRDGEYLQTEQFFIPWHHIRSSLSRHDKRKLRRPPIRRKSNAVIPRARRRMAMKYKPIYKGYTRPGDQCNSKLNNKNENGWVRADDLREKIEDMKEFDFRRPVVVFCPTCGCECRVGGDDKKGARYYIPILRPLDCEGLPEDALKGKTDAR